MSHNPETACLEVERKMPKYLEVGRVFLDYKVDYLCGPNEQKERNLGLGVILLVGPPRPIHRPGKCLSTVTAKQIHDVKWCRSQTECCIVVILTPFVSACDQCHFHFAAAAHYTFASVMDILVFGHVCARREVRSISVFELLD
jgi:hypothetical protein